MIKVEETLLYHWNDRPCLLCQLVENFPTFNDWRVVGEGVVRGQCFQRDVWRYVLVRDLRHVDVTAEFLDGARWGHEDTLRALVGGS